MEEEKPPRFLVLDYSFCEIDRYDTEAAAIQAAKDEGSDEPVYVVEVVGVAKRTAPPVAYKSLRRKAKR